MFIVDYVTFGRLPFREMDYELGMLDEWMEKIAEAEELARDFTYVATGHGPVGNRAGITEWRQYFEDLRAAVSDGIAAGMSLEEMQQEITMDDYSHWGGHDWVHENVLAMYHFLTD